MSNISIERNKRVPIIYIDHTEESKQDLLQSSYEGGEESWQPVDVEPDISPLMRTTATQRKSTGLEQKKSRGGGKHRKFSEEMKQYLLDSLRSNRALKLREMVLIILRKFRVKVTPQCIAHNLSSLKNLRRETAALKSASESITPTYQNEPETVSRLKPTFEIMSSTNSMIQNDSSSHPTAAKVQKTSDRQFGNQFFGERRQMAFSQSSRMGEQRVRLPSQTQMQQRIQIAAPPAPAPVPAPQMPRQVQMLTPPVQVAVAKPKPVEKPRPQEKRIFVVADHQRCVMSNLSFLWKNKKLCDAGIGNGESTVMVHKVVLSAVCPKLLSVFSTDVLSQKFLQINFPEEVSTEALNAFAEYMYNGMLDLDPDILEQLKIIAKRLDMKEFEQLCDSHLPNPLHQPAAAATAGSFANVPMIQTTMPISAMTSSLGSTGSTSVQFAPSITAQVVDVKQEITEADLDQVKKETAAVFGQESEVVSLAPSKSGNAAGFVICPSVKTEPVGPEDDRYGQVSNTSSNQVFQSTPSSSLATATAASSTSISSIPTSSTGFTIPFSQSTDNKFTKLKSTNSYDSPVVSDLSPVSCIVETMCSQSNPMGINSSKSLNWLPAFKSSTESPSTSTNDNDVYPLELYTTEADNRHLFNTTQIVDGKNINAYKTNMT